MNPARRPEEGQEAGVGGARFSVEGAQLVPFVNSDERASLLHCPAGEEVHQPLRFANEDRSQKLWGKQRGPLSSLLKGGSWGNLNRGAPLCL